MEQRPLTPRYERPKSWFWVGWKTVPFSPFVDQSSPNLVAMYGSDRLQRRFPVDDILFQSGDICNKVAKWRSCWKLRSSPQKFLGRRTPKIRCTHFMPLWGHIKYESLVQFPQQIPTILANVHQILANFQISGVKKLLGQIHPQWGVH